MMSVYQDDFGTVPPAARGNNTPSDMNQNAFGQGTFTLGFGLLTMNGYCGNRAVLACADTNYLPGSDKLGAIIAWAFFRQPNVFPMKNVAGFYDNNQKGYGHTCSYSYRRWNGQGQGYGTAPYISWDRLRLEQIPLAFVACSQQIAGVGTTENYTHDRRGSNALRRDGSVAWVPMLTEYLPYTWPFNWPFSTPPMKFWATADAQY